MPPGDARLRVSVEVMDPANEDAVAEDSADEAILTIPFSNMASEDGESPFLVIVIVALTLLVLYGGYNTARKGSSEDSDFIVCWTESKSIFGLRHMFNTCERQQCSSGMKIYKL